MKVDIGFWNKNGEYKEDIQEVEMLSVKDLNEIELIKGQNEGLRKQNAELQQEINTLKSQLDFEVQKKEVLETKLNEFADKFYFINDYEDVLQVKFESEECSYMTEEPAIWGNSLDDLKNILRDFTDFVEEIK